MMTSYGVVWREGEEPVTAGKLELLPNCIRLEGRDGVRVIPYERLSAVRVGRSAADRLSGQPSIVAELSSGQSLTIATVAQPSMVGEIAGQLTASQRDS
jgi:hypothetical protein